MKKLFLSIAMGVALLTTSVSCQNSAKTAPPKAPVNNVQNEHQSATPMFADLSVTEFQKKLAIDNMAILLDVRTPEEFVKGHLQNATAINFFDADFKEKVSKLDKTKPIYVYCAAGGRSSKALKVLQESGFKTAYNMIGGFNGWQAAGFPSVR
jgi:rhodanese-related sulfurtransferase